MGLEELYARVGGSYRDAVAYLRSERLVERLVLKFPSDTSCPRLFAAWEAGDLAAAFEAAHEAKGVCSNLYLSELARLAGLVTEELRGLDSSAPCAKAVDTHVAELRAAYERTIAAISDYAATR